MADDDKEKDELPPHVEKALAAARAAAKGERSKGTPGGRWLALVPVTVGVLFFALLMPRATEPRDIPMPAIDGTALKRAIRADHDRAARARTTPLPDKIRAVGTAIRALNRAQVEHVGDPAVDQVVDAARAAVDDAKKPLGKESIEDLVTLRAVMLEEFLDEVARFESTGKESNELIELGAGFVPRMRDAGWIDGTRVVLEEPQRRAAYKLVWNSTAGIAAPEFALTVDEERALYTLYIARPHVGEAVRFAVQAELSQAKTPEACERAQANERRLVEMWRADKIHRLANIDPQYPTDYALGVAYYRAGRYESSIDYFRRWIDRHPDGPYALRARNHLRAALAAYGAI